MSELPDGPVIARHRASEDVSPATIPGIGLTKRQPAASGSPRLRRESCWRGTSDRSGQAVPVLLLEYGSRGDGRSGRMLKTLGRVQLLILDDWRLSVLKHRRKRL